MGDWRKESTFTPSSKLSEEEKTFLKLAKKIREIRKLEDKQKGGEELDAKQLEKLESLPGSIEELIALVPKFPKGSEVLQKNPDMAELVPSSAVKENERRRQQEEERKQLREAEERRKRETVEFRTQHEKPITDIAVSSDGAYIFTSSKDKLVLCWSTAEKLLKVVRTYGGHQGAVWAVDCSTETPPRLASGAADERVLFWTAEAPRGRPAVTPPDGTLQHGGIVKFLRWCPYDASKLATASDKLGSQPHQIAVWQVDARGRGAENLVKMQELPAKANTLQWGGSLTTKVLLFSGHENGYVAVWDANRGQLLKTIKLHAEPVSSLCMAADGKTLLSASRDSTAVALDVSTREMPKIQTWRTNRPLNAVAVSPEFAADDANGAVVLGGGSEEVHVTTTKEIEGEFEAQVYSSEGEFWASVKGHFGPIHTIRFVPGSGFATGAEDGCLYVHDLYGRRLHTDNMRDGGR